MLSEPKKFRQGALYTSTSPIPELSCVNSVTFSHLHTITGMLHFIIEWLHLHECLAASQHSQRKTQFNTLILLLFLLEERQFCCFLEKKNPSFVITGSNGDLYYQCPNSFTRYSKKAAKKWAKTEASCRWEDPSSGRRRASRRRGCPSACTRW